MRSNRRTWAGLLVLLTAGLALAGSGGGTGTVEGQNGWTATELFRSTDIESALSEWSGMTNAGILLNSTSGSTAQAIAENSTGDLYVLFAGTIVDEDPSSTDPDPRNWYSGIVKYDGSGFTHVLKTSMTSAWYDLRTDSDNDGAWDFPDSVDAREGERVAAVYTVPADAPGLKKDDLLVVRWFGDTKSWNGSVWTGDHSLELVRYPADSSSAAGVDVSAEEILFTWNAAWMAQAHLVVDGGGNIYAAALGIEEYGVIQGEAIWKIAYNSGTGSYTGSELIAGTGVHIAFDGTYLYAPGNFYGSNSGDILQILPSTGASVVFSDYDQNNREALRSMAFDSSGGLYLDLSDDSNSRGFVSAAVALGSATHADRIADTPYPPHQSAMTARADGGLYVASCVYSVVKSRGSTSYTLLHEAVFSLAPSSGGSGGDAGGGNGGGKGKNK